MRLNTETRKGQLYLSVHENDRTIAHAAGDTVEDAAIWLVRHVNRIARQTEDLLIAAGHITAEEIEKLLDADDLH
jgi:hypothetical protein